MSTKITMNHIGGWGKTVPDVDGRRPIAKHKWKSVEHIIVFLCRVGLLLDLPAENVTLAKCVNLPPTSAQNNSNKIAAKRPWFTQFHHNELSILILYIIFFFQSWETSTRRLIPRHARRQKVKSKINRVKMKDNMKYGVIVGRGIYGL